MNSQREIQPNKIVINSKYPLFSIVTPSFNQAQFIRQTIDSVLNQSYQNIEYIVVDGNSNDGTFEILESYRDLIDHIIIENDQGQSDAINKGLALAKGSLLMWLNSDDILLPNSIQTAVDCFSEHPDALIVHGHSELFGYHLKPKLIGEFSGELLTRYPAYMCYPQPASFFRKELISLTGDLDTHLHYAMDFDLTVRAYLNGKIVYTPYLFSKYRIHATSKTNNSILFVREWSEVFSRFINTFPIYSTWLRLLIDEGFHTGTTLQYPCHTLINVLDFEQIFYNHFYTCAHMLYQAGQDQESLRYICFLKKFLPKQYNTSSLNMLKIRMLINPRLRNLCRKLTSQ